MQSLRDRKRESSRRFREANRDAINEASRERRLTDPVAALLTPARANAKRRGLEFDLDREWLESKLRAGVCEVTGVELDLTTGSPRRPSLDRVEHSAGYVKQNVRVTTWIFNRARGPYSDEELYELVVRPLAAVEV